jgi:hypothetical protein
LHANIQPYIRGEFGRLLKNYWRDLQQSQPNHLEIVGEKNTIMGTIRPIAMEYCVPMTIGRGYSSLVPRKQINDRFARSGKEKLVLIYCTDFDPEGEDIAHSFARSMRDDFGVHNIVPVKVALSKNQVEELSLPPQMEAKPKSSRTKKFVEKNGKNVYELEAIPPRVLQTMLRDAIDHVMDINAFNREVDAEKQEAAYLEGYRKTVLKRTGQLDSVSVNGKALDP